jgi:hypothetical protein
MAGLPDSLGRSRGLGTGNAATWHGAVGQVPAAGRSVGVDSQIAMAQARTVVDCRASCAAISSSQVRQSGQISQSASSLTGSQRRNSAEAGPGASRRHRMHSFTAISDIASPFDDRGGGYTTPSLYVTVRAFRVAVSILAAR